MRKKLLKYIEEIRKKTYLAKAEGAMLFLDLPLISMNAGLHGWVSGNTKKHYLVDPVYIQSVQRYRKNRFPGKNF